MVWVDVRELRVGGNGRGAYAARFWAFRRLCAGVRDSFSSLLLRVCDCSGLS